MAVTTPQWLRQRSGELRESTLPGVWLVILNGEPQYRLVPVPAQGRFACEVLETASGKQLGSGQAYPTSDDALRGELEHLRRLLGW